MADDQNNTANPNVSATAGEKGLLDVLAGGFAKGVTAIALLALVGLPLAMGALASVGGVDIQGTGQHATFMQGVMGGGGMGAGILFQGPGIIAMALGGIVGSLMAQKSNQQAVAVSNIAQQNAELKSQLQEQEQVQQSVNVQVDNPKHGGWRHRVTQNNQPMPQQGAEQYAPMGYQTSYANQPPQQYMNPPQQQGYAPPPQQYVQYQPPQGQPVPQEKHMQAYQPQYEQQGFAAQELERRRNAQAQAMDPNMQGVRYA